MNTAVCTAGLTAALSVAHAAPPEVVIHETFDTQHSIRALPIPPGQLPEVLENPAETGQDANDPLGPVYERILPMDGGGAFASFFNDFGIIRNLAALSSPSYNGPAEGPDPLGQHGGMLHVQRASLANPSYIHGPSTGRRLYTAEHEPVVAGHGEAVFFSMDFYKGSHRQAIWFDAVQSPAPSWASVVRGYIGGDFTGHVIFERVASLYGAPGVNEGFMMYEHFYSKPTAPDPCVSPRAIPEHGWITIGILFTPDRRRSVWIRDRETIAEAVTPMRTSGPFAGRRMFDEYGFGLEEGWAQIYPGTDDDPSTPDLVEGYGPAISADRLPPLPTFRELDANGNMVSAPETFWAPGVSGWNIYAGVDQPDDPTYAVEDWWADNYKVLRSTLEKPCPADLDDDGAVGVADLALLLSEAHDDSRDKARDVADLLAAWGDRE